MFPLGTPLLPGALLPLHVFELRYRMMMDDVLASEPHEFGVVMIERGHEVGGGDVRSAVGTLARVVRSEEADDGRRAVIAFGSRRLRVVEWLPDDPYPVASVEDWPIADGAEAAGDDDGSDGDVGVGVSGIEQDLVTRVSRFVALVRRLDERAPDVDGRSLDEELVDYVYRVASSLPVGPADRQAVLSASSSAEAARRLASAIDDLDALVRFRTGLGTDD